MAQRTGFKCAGRHYKEHLIKQTAKTDAMTINHSHDDTVSTWKMVFA